MKAILKATGEIVTVECRWVTTIGGNDVLRFIDQKTGYSYTEHQLAILFQEDNNREPDYWTRLEHQYAGMIVQGMVEHNGINFLNDAILNVAVQKAHALVEKLKEMEGKK
jgi:hypothetical protein